MPTSPTTRRRTTGRSVVAVLCLLAALAGCSGDGGAAAHPPPPGPPATETPSAGAEPLVYVAVGASETVGVGSDDPAREAWPQVLHDTALPESALVNVGVPGATVRGALAAQLPRAVAADPDVATVWLAVNDVVTAVPVAGYERRLRRLVHALRRDGRTEVLVGNVPDLWRLPAYRACLPGSRVTAVPCVLPVVPSERDVRRTVAEFNAAVRRVARAEGARLVDLSGQDDLTGLTSGDGFHPSTAGHRAVAEAFAGELPG